MTDVFIRCPFPAEERINAAAWVKKVINSMMLDVKRVAKLLSVSEKTVYRWISKSEIPAYRIGESYRFNNVELLEWATARKIQISHEIFDENHEDSEEPLSLVQALEAGGIHYKVPGKNKEDAIRSAVEVMTMPEGINKKYLTEALLIRENLGSTAIGDGIAIPHVRNPIVFHINTPILSLCFIQHPVDFGALDAKPVDTLFMIVTPTVRAHLQVLSRLSYLLHLPKVREKIDPSCNPSDIIDTVREAEHTIEKAGKKK